MVLHQKYTFSYPGEWLASQLSLSVIISHGEEQASDDREAFSGAKNSMSRPGGIL